MSERSTTSITDVAMLRALAHPLRVAMLTTLRTDGPATASHLARRHDETSGATSYHLRQLARFGFVEEDPDQPSRRERRWRATSEMTSWRSGDFIDDPAGREAMALLERRQLEHLTRSGTTWLDERHAWRREWVDAAGMSDIPLRLRAEDLAELNDQLLELVTTFPERPATDSEAERVQVFLSTFPHRDATHDDH